MSVTSGFFDSLDGDRKYNAEQMSAIFNGIINDGVFASIGTALAVTANSGNTVNVGIGRAWFNSTWINNDAVLPLTLTDAATLQNRYDAIVVEVDRSYEVRAGTIKIVTGTAAASPSKPAMTSTEYVHQYPLAYIYRAAGSSSISQADITSMIGTSSCPYITGILEVLSIDSIVAQWEAEWNEWFNSETSEDETSFDAWFKSLQAILDDDVATNLANEILALKTLTEITLKAADWSGSSAPYTQEISLSGVTEETSLNDLGIIYPEDCTRDEQKAINKASGYIYDVETGDGIITVRATAMPLTDITLGFKGVG